MGSHPRWGPRTGRTTPWAGLILLLALGLGLWALSRGGDTPQELPSAPLGPAEVQVSVPAPLPDISEAPRSPRDVGPSEAIPQLASRTDGIGSLRGVLLDRTGKGIPKNWTLVLSPNTAIRTPTPRRELRFEFHEGEERFHVEEVPLGAYDVWVDALGANRRTTPMLLVKGSDSPFVSLELNARGYLEGVVLDEAGEAVGDLSVTLLSVSKQGDRTTRTDGAGRYLFDDLIDGEYQLVMGARNNPLVGPEDLAFQAPSLHYPPRRVPKLGSVMLRAVDVNRRPIVGARVDGFAPDGGVMGGDSDSGGYCEVKNLVPGRYRLTVRGQGDAVGRAVCIVAPGARAEIEVIVRD